MTKKVYVVTDLGPGDGGKGGVVHKIATMMNAHTIIKDGGGQGNHGVVTSNGERFGFSHWGCATFEGVRTHCSSRIVVVPEELVGEAEALEREWKVYKPFSLLTIDRDALCATPYHTIASRLRELARGNNPRGTVGSGVGVAYRDRDRFPDLAIYVRDLGRVDLRDRVAAVRAHVQREMEPILAGAFLPQDAAVMEQEKRLLFEDHFLDYSVSRLQEVARRATIVDHDYLGREILSKDGVVVVERSHGILTDHFQGFHPHTSALRTLPRFVYSIIEETGYDGAVVKIGVRRAYEIRHGAGPIPTNDPSMVEHLLPGSHKEVNRWQGHVQVGPLDFALFRYAIEACGGPGAFDGLAITWFDQVMTNGGWNVSRRYRGALDEQYFTPRGDIRVRFGEDEQQLRHQEQLGVALRACTPEVECIPLDRNADREKLFDVCAGVISENVNVPVRMVSFGPTELDKICK